MSKTTLRATFAMPATRLESIHEKDQERAGSHRRVSITRARNTGDTADCCHATGAAQEVMFLIGAVAAQGEDCLITVGRL